MNREMKCHFQAESQQVTKSKELQKVYNHTSLHVPKHINNYRHNNIHDHPEFTDSRRSSFDLNLMQLSIG